MKRESNTATAEVIRFEKGSGTINESFRPNYFFAFFPGFESPALLKATATNIFRLASPVLPVAVTVFGVVA